MVGAGWRGDYAWGSCGPVDGDGEEALGSFSGVGAGVDVFLAEEVHGVFLADVEGAVLDLAWDGGRGA